MKMTSKIEYLGELRTEAEHLFSGNKIITDAPLDNNGKAQAFSPTDLVATALGSCMVTIMGIKAASLGYDLPGIKIDITKKMEANPRRISGVKVALIIPHSPPEKDKQILEAAGLACPVAKSLHPDLKQDISFVWQASE